MSDNPVLEVIGKVHDRIGKLDEKVDKVGTVTTELQISQARIEERLKSTNSTVTEVKGQVRKVAGIWASAIAGIVVAIAGAVAAAFKMGGGG